MGHFCTAVMNLLIVSGVVMLLLVTPAFPGEAPLPLVEEVASSIREVKDALGMFLIVHLWLMLAAGTAAVCLLGRAFLLDLTSQLDFVARNVTALRSSLIGFLNGMILFLIAAAAIATEQFAPIAVVLVIFLAGMIYFGLLAATLTLGEKILALKAEEFSDFAKIITGTAILFIAALVPIIGWAVFLYFVIKSLGIAVIWLVRRRNLAEEVFAHE